MPSRNRHRAPWLRTLLLLLVLVLAGCTAGDPSRSPLDTPTGPTPTPVAVITTDAGETPIYFPVQRPKLMSRAVGLLGTLILDNGCLRVQPRPDVSQGESLAMIWPANYSLSVDERGIRVRDDKGTVIARLGDIVVAGGASGHPQRIMDEPAPAPCHSPYWITGEWGETLTEYSFGDSAIVLVRRDPFEPNISEEGDLTGTLTNVDGCLRVQNQETDQDYLPLWPPNFALEQQDDTIQVVDGDGNAVAQVEANVQLEGGDADTSARNWSQDLLAGRCSGPFWLVGAVVDAAD